jgi:hypothetical protein
MERRRKSINSGVAAVIKLAYELRGIQDGIFIVRVDRRKWDKTAAVAANAAAHGASIWQDYKDVPLTAALFADLQSVGFELWTDFVATCRELLLHNQMIVLITDLDDEFTRFLEADLHTDASVDIFSFSIE